MTKPGLEHLHIFSSQSRFEFVNKLIKHYKITTTTNNKTC